MLALIITPPLQLQSRRSYQPNHRGTLINLQIYPNPAKKCDDNNVAAQAHNPDKPYTHKNANTTEYPRELSIARTQNA